LRPVHYGRPAWQLAAAAVLAAVVLFSGVLAVSPGARDAVAGWLGLRGIEIKQTPTPPAAPTRLIGAGLDLGSETTLTEAGHLIGFAARVPSALGDPDAVFVNSLSTGQRELFLVYRPRRGVPESLQTGVGALLSEFRGGINGPFVRKSASSGQVSFVRVNGNPGFWIRGAHDLVYLDRSGNPVEESFRLSGSALIWEQEGIVFRLESALSLKRALTVARGL
jgi:hypothetical protein